MNILFYVEPLIEKGLPYFKEAWATSWSRKMGHALKDNWNCYIGLNDALAEKFGDDKFFQIIVFQQAELLDPFENGFLEASSAWYDNSYTDAQIGYYIELMRKKFYKIKFDAIITFTPVPFFRKLYPNAKIFHMEYSIFSRLPFPQTWYLDPVGIHKYSFLSKYKDKIKKIELSAAERNCINRLQDTCVNVFKEKNIFEDDIALLRKKYKFLVLLPIQCSQYYLFDCHAKWRNQFDYLMGVLSKVPVDIGVIFTMHPDYLVFSKETISYVQSRYSNAIFLNNSMYVYSASQWIMPYVDGVITVSSSLGWQTLLFKKKLFAIGNGDMDYIADAKNLDNMHEIMNADHTDKDIFLWFYITKYSIPSEYIFNSKWLNAFLQHSCESQVDENFFGNIDKPKKIIEQHINKIVGNRHCIPQWVNSMTALIPYLYFLQDKNFSENQVLHPCKFIFKDYYKVTFDISKQEKGEKIRFVPIKGKFCCLEIMAIEASGKTFQCYAYNGYKLSRNRYKFLTLEPIIEIIGDFSNINYITIAYKNHILLEEDISKEINGIINEINSIKQSRGYRVLEKIKFVKRKIFNSMCSII